MNNSDPANLLMSYLHEVATMLMLLREQELPFDLSDREVEYVDRQMLRIDRELAYIRLQAAANRAGPLRSAKA